MTAILIIVLTGLAYFGYMKFYYPKFKAQYEQYDQEATTKWNQEKDEIIAEYLYNRNKFGLFSDVINNEKLKGIISGKIPKTFKSKIFSGLKDAVTFTKEMDMSHTYLVASDKNLYYLGFDGKKCFINEVFDFDNIHNIKFSKDNLTLDYKDEGLKFNIDNESPIAIAGYPRFAIHERDKVATSNDRTLNYFVREYFAYEPTNNASFKQSNQTVSFNTDALKVSLEQLLDYKVREHFVTEFKKKMGIK